MSAKRCANSFRMSPGGRSCAIQIRLERSLCCCSTAHSSAPRSATANSSLRHCETAFTRRSLRLVKVNEAWRLRQSRQTSCPASGELGDHLAPPIADHQPQDPNSQQHQCPGGGFRNKMKVRLQRPLVSIRRRGERRRTPIRRSGPFLRIHMSWILRELRKRRPATAWPKRPHSA